MNSSRPTGRIWRGVDAPRATAATLAVELPGAARASTSSVAERIEAARAEGYQQGLAEAEADAACSAAEERRRQLARMADAMCAAADAVVDGRQRATVEAQATVVQLAVDLAEAVVRRELAMGRQPAVEALRRAVSLVPSGEDLLVRVHPGDVVPADELQSLVPTAAVRVLADPAVEPGGCVVDAGACHVDAQIGPALARARQLLAALGPVKAQEPVGALGPVGVQEPVAEGAGT